MELKSYQRTTLDMLNRYLAALNEERRKAERAREFEIDYDWDSKAWAQLGMRRAYGQRVNGAGERVPSICMKIPTGGGKTLLAIHAIDSISTAFRRANTGLVLWIVPTNAIYRQTLRALRDRAHPYRQLLDITSMGRTLIAEKTRRFSKADVEERLVVLLLMLPSANRQNKETLRMFQDQGGFDSFFPADDLLAEHEAYLRHTPNLETFAPHALSQQRQLKTSLGNVLRLCRPLIVLDEGHKAYSATAQETLFGFNPCFVLELSATPTPESNTLVNISGSELLREGMIKLDINLNLKSSPNWHDTLRAAHEKRLQLEAAATAREKNGERYIRPICLVQVERTGANQRQQGLIHAEDAREFLITQCVVPAPEIAIKSSERDELEDTDLMSPDSPIRYIITSRALQEGWDCPFAYVLAILPNSKQSASLTQLVGRVLRQPYAQKTGEPLLDESYVYCSREGATAAVQAVRKGLVDEGLGDVEGRVAVHDERQPTQLVEVPVREKFRHYAGKVYLPCFVVPNGQDGYREFNYQADMLSRIDWDGIDLGSFDSLVLNPEDEGDSMVRVGLSNTIPGLLVSAASNSSLETTFLTRQLADVVPNPWMAYDLAHAALERLRRRYEPGIINRNRSFIINELRGLLLAERTRLAEQVFRRMVQEDELRFFLISGGAGAAIPERITMRANARRLVNQVNGPLQRSLFEEVPEDDYNETLERPVAVYLDQQQRVLWWYRNIAKLNYGVQGWQPHRVYADFVALRDDLAPDPADPVKETVYVLELKGNHLQNPDTRYKQSLFDLCNSQCVPTPWNQIEAQFADHRVEFQVIFQHEWQNNINRLFA
jgi:type III restriction enzyme